MSWTLDIVYDDEGDFEAVRRDMDLVLEPWIHNWLGEKFHRGELDHLFDDRPASTRGLQGRRHGGHTALQPTGRRGNCSRVGPPFSL